MFQSLIRDADVISFDFFDTLITRFSACPDAVQHYVGYLLSLQKSALRDFFEQRKRAEASARNKHHELGDVDLDMIYQEFPVDAPWTRSAIERAKRLEQEIDKRFIVPRSEIVRLLESAKRQNKRVIVVSDTYYSPQFIEDILDKFGLRAFVDEMYVSSDRKMRKDTGALWKLISDRETAAKKRLVHFGDSLYSDDTTARCHGVDCAHVPDPLSVVADRGLTYSPNRDWRSDILLGPLFARFGNNPIATVPVQGAAVISDEVELGNVVYGPILLAFFGWLTETPAIKRIQRLFFTSREGYFLQKLYQSLRREFGFTDLPPSQYFPISRRVVNTACQASAFDPCRVIDGGGFQGTVEDFMKARFGLEVQWPSKFVFPVSVPGDRDYLARILTILRTQILEKAEREREALLTYCRQVGLLEDEMIGLVDAGYSGTIQAGLQMLLGRPFVGFYMATSPRVDQVRSGGGVAFGCFQDALYADLRPDGFMHKTLLLEAFLTAPHGQVTKFEKDSQGGARPVYQNGGLSQDSYHRLERIFEGALNYCLDVLHAGGREVLGAIVPARMTAFVGLDAVLAGAIRVSQTLADALRVEDNFTGNGEIAPIAGVGQ